jgi:hypothetical protein
MRAAKLILFQKFDEPVALSGLGISPPFSEYFLGFFEQMILRLLSKPHYEGADSTIVNDQRNKSGKCFQTWDL